MGTTRLGWCVAAAALTFIGCGTRGESTGVVTTKYDPATGKLAQVTINADLDGKPNVYSYMDGGAFVRIEIDTDEDGKIDRWEYYGRDQRLTKVGKSRSNNGSPDLWVYAAADGTVERTEVSTRSNGIVNRTEYYMGGRIVRAEEDTNGDGRVDKWEKYEGDALTAVSFDTTHSGKPTVTLDYTAERAGSTR